jgi:thiamine transport system substrate-binding protein
MGRFPCPTVRRNWRKRDATFPCGVPDLPCHLAAMAETPVLTVLTYDSFTSEWGPGPAVEKAFEASCACDLRLCPAGDGAALLARLQLEGAASEADVVLGLDTGLTAAAAATGLFAPHGQPAATALPVAYDDPLFLPFDWGWFAFVYDKTKLPTPPKSFEALAASDLKVVIQDPRSSTPGLGLLLWVKAAYGEGAARSGRRWPTTSSPSPPAGPRPMACSWRARPTWCCPTPPRPPIT